MDIHYFVQKDCDVHWHIPKSRFRSNGLVLCLSGSAQYAINGQRYVIEAGELIAFPRGCIREASTTTGMSCIALDYTLPTSMPIDFPIKRSFHYSDELKRLMRELSFEWLMQSDGYETKCGGLLLLILHELKYGNDSGATAVYVRKIQRYILEHYQQAFTVADVAAHVQLSPVYCGALFKKERSQTILEYANLIRSRRAAVLLTESSQSLADIADACGFSDIYYFSRVFKRNIGESPAAYRRRLT